MSLLEYIDKYYGGVQTRFADHVGVQRNQVYQWIQQGVVIEGRKMYKPKQFKRELPAPPRRRKGSA